MANKANSERIALMMAEAWSNEDYWDMIEDKDIKRDGWLTVLKVIGLVVVIGALICGLIAILH